ncbi:MAG: SPOR domain-containing protein, partial [Gammaproteobacteria bacterium]
MNLQQKCGLFVRLLVSVLPLAVAAEAVGAGKEVISGLEIFQDKDWPEIYINLNTPMHYVSHSPRTSSDTIEVTLQPVSATGIDNDVLNSTQSLPWDGSSGGIPLSEVTYDGTAATNRLIQLRFEHPVAVTVRSTPDRTALAVTINASSSQGPTVDSGQRQAQARPVAEASHSWVVNLQSSLRPIDTTQVPRLNIFRSHRLYTARFKNGDRVWYRLRLGFFDTPEDAHKVMEQLRAYFGDLWIGIALEEEKQVVSARAIAKQGAAGNSAAAQPQGETTAVEPLSRPQTGFDLSGRFALNLASSPEPVRFEDVPTARELEAHILYITSAIVDGRRWHSLR